MRNILIAVALAFSSLASAQWSAPAQFGPAPEDQSFIGKDGVYSFALVREGDRGVTQILATESGSTHVPRLRVEPPSAQATTVAPRASAGPRSPTRSTCWRSMGFGPMNCPAYRIRARMRQVRITASSGGTPQARATCTR